MVSMYYRVIWLSTQTYKCGCSSWKTSLLASYTINYKRVIAFHQCFPTCTKRLVLQEASGPCLSCAGGCIFKTHVRLCFYTLINISTCNLRNLEFNCYMSWSLHVYFLLRCELLLLLGVYQCEVRFLYHVWNGNAANVPWRTWIAKYMTVSVGIQSG